MFRSCAGEPTSPILEVTPVKSSNSAKVKWTKQDDGGSPIKHYLIRYKAVSTPGKEVTGCHFATFSISSPISMRKKTKSWRHPAGKWQQERPAGFYHEEKRQ